MEYCVLRFHDRPHTQKKDILSSLALFLRDSASQIHFCCHLFPWVLWWQIPSQQVWKANWSWSCRWAGMPKKFQKSVRTACGFGKSWLVKVLGCCRYRFFIVNSCGCHELIFRENYEGLFFLGRDDAMLYSSDQMNYSYDCIMIVWLCIYIFLYLQWYLINILRNFTGTISFSSLL